MDKDRHEFVRFLFKIINSFEDKKGKRIHRHSSMSSYAPYGGLKVWIGRQFSHLSLNLQIIIRSNHTYENANS